LSEPHRKKRDVCATPHERRALTSTRPRPIIGKCQNSLPNKFRNWLGPLLPPTPRGFGTATSSKRFASELLRLPKTPSVARYGISTRNSPPRSPSLAEAFSKPSLSEASNRSEE